MHEMSLAVDLMRQIDGIIEQNGVSKVHKVVLHVGVQKLVVPEAMQEAFRAITEGTRAEGALLELIEIPALVQCRVCMHQYEPKIDDYRCPVCSEADVTFLRGNDIILASMECDVDTRTKEP